MSRLTLPTRLARREVLRRPGRTLLVALLVALPVAGMAMAVTVIRADSLTRAEDWAANQGTADARLWGSVGAAGSGVDLPAESRVLEIRSTYLRLRSGERRVDLELSDRSMTDPMTTGLRSLVDGREARAPGEVALSRRAADRLGVEVGATVPIVRHGLDLTVVGMIENPRCIGCEEGLVASGWYPDLIDGTDRFGVLSLVDLPELTRAEEIALVQASGDTLTTRSLFVDGYDRYVDKDGGVEAVRWSLVMGALVLTVAGIVISAAFAVGARRQLVTLGQLSASGASPTTVRTMLVLQGTLTGVIGTIAGFMIAALVLILGRGRLEIMLDHRLGSYDPRPLDLIGVAVIGVVAATLAALIPARTAARLPTLAALAGRRPMAPVSRRLVARGFGAVVIGLALLGIAVLGSAGGRSGNTWAVVAVIGGVIELLGACAIAPALVARLEPIAGRVRGSWRLAARGLARQRSRTGAVVSAVAAACALTIAATALVLGSEAKDPGYLEVADDVVVAQEHTQTTFEIPAAEGGGVGYDQRSAPLGRGLSTEIEAILAGAEVSEVRVATTAIFTAPEPGSMRHSDADWVVVSEAPGAMPAYGDGANSFGLANAFSDAVVADDAVLDAIHASDALVEQLEDDGFVVLHGGRGGPATIELPDGRTHPATIVRAEHTVGYLSQVLVRPELAEELDLVTTAVATMYRLPEDISAAQDDDLNDLMGDLGFQLHPSDTSLNLQWHGDEDGPSPFQLELLLSGIALVFSLFVVGASLALAAAESKDERDVLTVAGAPPGSLARAAGARAWLLAGLGAVLAVPVGFLPVVVFTQADAGDLPLIFPARTALLLLVVVPTIVGAIALATSATAQRFRPVRVSTATFE